MSKIVLITGGSRGLGREMAVEAAKRGIDVVLTYRARAEEAEKVVKEISALGRKAAALPLDTGKAGSFPAFVSSLQEALQKNWNTARFDYLVNNAGIGLHKPFGETSEAEFDELMNVHFKGVYFLTQALLPHINDRGRILNISSGLTRFTFPGASAYAAMKGGIEVLSRYLAVELGARGISVNTLAPGAIETDFGGGRVRDNAELNQQVARMTALGRAGKPEDIGGVVANLLLSEMGWINGQRIEASGGMLV